MKLRANIWCLVCLMCLVGFVAPIEAADGRLEEFILKFESLDEKQTSRSEWLGPESPFAPYLEHPVFEGLGESERVLYGRAFDAGACRVVRMLDEVGFLNRYPHLAPVFERSKVRAVFSVFVLPQLKGTLERCVRSRGGNGNLPQRPEYPPRRNGTG